jgi:hypothetical protein|nr:MAG TPA: Protein of unknown function (DUF1653) [Caudoviricetes sp.]
MNKYDRNIPEPGTIVRHFKRETIRNPGINDYLYEIVGLAEHTESKENMMIYRALYESGKLYARPIDMFMSEVDHNKYPSIQQKYRFENNERSNVI